VDATAFRDFVLNFSSILWEALPFIVLGAVLAGILEELLPQELIGKIMPKHAVFAVMIGGVLGLVFPMCECGIVVVMRRLLRKGLPLACCISYMLAGPILNVVVILSTYVAFGSAKVFGLEMVLLRCGFGFVVACITGLVVHLMQQKYGNAQLLKEIATPKPSPAAISLSVVQENIEEAPEPKKPVWKRLSNISETALHDFLDITTFLIIGALLAAFAKSLITPEYMTDLTSNQPYLAIPAMMLLAIVLCLCSEADAFVAASFKEMSLSAKLSFLVLGPMLDLKLIFMYTRVFKLKLILALIACTFSQVLIYCLIFHTIYNPSPEQLTAVKTTTPTVQTEPK
jgi:uncharacterized protein